jgi:hypothetical protein
MNPEDPAASVRELATQLIACRRDDVGDAPPPGTPGAVALERLSGELCRWIGDDGCRVLLSRALTRAQRSRPALADLRVGSGAPPVIEGLEEGLAAHGSAAIALGLEDTMIAMLDLLRRLIGEDLTTRLAERSTTGGAPGAIPPTKKGRRPND